MHTVFFCLRHRLREFKNRRIRDAGVTDKLPSSGPRPVGMVQELDGNRRSAVSSAIQTRSPRHRPGSVQRPAQCHSSLPAKLLHRSDRAKPLAAAIVERKYAQLPPKPTNNVATKRHQCGTVAELRTQQLFNSRPRHVPHDVAGVHATNTC